MITVRLNGGLGNQMFQYAFSRALAISNNTEILIDVDVFDTCELRSFEMDKYNINASIFSRKYSKNKILNPQNILIKILKKINLEALVPNYYFEKELLFDRKFLDIKNGAYLEGYFQSEKYFLHIRKILLNEFTIKEGLSPYTKRVAKSILNSKNSVSLHVRRGDYISVSCTNSIHGNCDLNYYDKSIKHIQEKIKQPAIFVFSDDIEWSKENLNYDNAIFVESDAKRMPHEDIFLMSLCNHNIIANSSFSWWGAWLNKNKEKIVIAPKKWFLDKDKQKKSGDIVPDSWLKI
jgi:hypothetical protein